MTAPRASVLVEAAVDSVDAALAAARAGADRLELCARLDVGGLTPEHDLLRGIAGSGVPALAMIRPRAGSFECTASELELMAGEIGRARAAGAAGLVLGPITGAGEIDERGLRVLMDAAGALPVTFHRAFDSLRDPVASLATLATHGVRRVLTSGGRTTAWEGRSLIRRLVAAAPAGLEIVAGGGVRGDHVAALVRETGVRAVHLAASRTIVGPGGAPITRPDPDRLRAVIDALAG